MRQDNRKTKRVAWLLTTVLVCACLSTVSAQQSSKGTAPGAQTSIEERLARVERQLDSQAQVDMLLRLENLQNEVQHMLGQLEALTHSADELKSRQRDLYLDLDRRLLQLERGGVAAAPAAAGASAATTMPDTPAPKAAATSGAAAAAASAASKTSAASVALPSADPAKEQQAYQVAFDLLRELRYDQAIDAFRAFLKDYPDGRYAHIAQYWLGEANYAQRRFKEAVVDYQKLIDQHPNSPKRAEAMLKIGYSHFELGETEKARATLEQLVAAYPQTTEAGQAQNLLQKMRANTAR